jgi:uncharacterized phage protein (TIGR02218 family)
MISASAPLVALLASASSFLMADLYTIVTLAGDTLRFTSADVDLTVGGNAFSSSMALTRDSITQKAGIEVDDLSVTFYPSPANQLHGVTFLQAVAAGFLDGADFTLERAFFAPDWGTCVGSIIRFYGRVSDISDFTRTEIPVSVKSYLELLNVKMPRNLYQPACRRTLYDGGCLVAKASYTANSTAQSGSSKTLILTTLSNAAGYFDMGEVVFTSGQNSGVTRTVKQHTLGHLLFALPLPFLPAAGDTFTAYPGCDHTMSTCSGKFSNLTHFAGEPFVPAPETAY